MVNITNGVNRMMVSNGAFKEMFAPQGWVIIGEEPTQEVTPTLEKAQTINETPDEEVDEQDIEEDSDEEETEEYEDDEDLLERPLSELSFDELKRVAEIRKVSITGLKSKKEIKKALRDAE